MVIIIKIKAMRRYVEECLSHLGVWGSNMRVFTKRSEIKKGDPFECRLRSSSSSSSGMQKDKGMILIGFLFYRSRGVVGRPGFRRDVPELHSPEVLLEQIGRAHV